MQISAKTLLTALLCTASVPLFAMPMGYSVNSDSGTTDAEGLYLIDLSSGSESRKGTVQSNLETRMDVEGLAFAPDETLYGLDDESGKLFAIDPSSGLVDTDSEVDIDGLPSEDNDFGMTFTCDGTLYVTSVANGALYRMTLQGDTQLVGSLGENISAIAAWGSPAKLYGLGNGTLEDDSPDAPSLFEINTTTGAATEVGVLGGSVLPYREGGLAFDDSGQLWAITDRRVFNQPSQIVRIDTGTGSGTPVAETTEQGFESLAVSKPGGCSTSGGGDPGYGDPNIRGVPTLDRAGLLLAALLLLVTGILAARRP